MLTRKHCNYGFVSTVSSKVFISIIKHEPGKLLVNFKCKTLKCALLYKGFPSKKKKERENTKQKPHSAQLLKRSFTRYVVGPMTKNSQMC